MGALIGLFRSMQVLGGNTNSMLQVSSKKRARHRFSQLPEVFTVRKTEWNPSGLQLSARCAKHCAALSPQTAPACCLATL